MEILIFYIFLGMFVFLSVVIQTVLGNKFTKNHIVVVLLFPLHSALALIVCWFGYSVYFYTKLKKLTKNKR